jgi:hypothetical protein
LLVDEGELIFKICILLLLAMVEREDVLYLTIYLLEGERAKLPLLGLLRREQGEAVRDGDGGVHFIIKYYVSRQYATY